MSNHSSETGTDDAEVKEAKQQHDHIGAVVANKLQLVLQKLAMLNSKKKELTDELRHIKQTYTEVHLASQSKFLNPHEVTNMSLNSSYFKCVYDMLLYR